jgi:hypothetical protein
MLWLETNKDGSGQMQLGGSLTRQDERELQYDESAHPHIANIGQWIICHFASRVLGSSFLVPLRHTLTYSPPYIPLLSSMCQVTRVIGWLVGWSAYSSRCKRRTIHASPLKHVLHSRIGRVIHTQCSRLCGSLMFVVNQKH